MNKIGVLGSVIVLAVMLAASTLFIVDQRQVAATCGQLQRQRGADATGRAGDHGHAAAKVQVAMGGHAVPCDLWR